MAKKKKAAPKKKKAARKKKKATPKKKAAPKKKAEAPEPESGAPAQQPPAEQEPAPQPAPDNPPAGSGRSASFAAGVSVSAEYSRRYGFDASSATRITARIVALPPPTIFLQRLGVAPAVINEAKSRTPPPVGGSADEPDKEELSPEEQAWQDFGLQWLDAVEPVVGQIEELRHAHLDQDDARSSEIAEMLATLAEVIGGVPDTPDGAEEMREFLETDEVVAAAEGPNAFGLTVEIKEPLLGLLASAP